MSFGRSSLLLVVAVAFAGWLPACSAAVEVSEVDESNEIQQELIESDQSGPRTTEPGDASTRKCKKDCGSRWQGCVTDCAKSRALWWCDQQCKCTVLDGKGWATCERENTIIDL